MSWSLKSILLKVTKTKMNIGRRIIPSTLFTKSYSPSTLKNIRETVEKEERRRGEASAAGRYISGER